MKYMFIFYFFIQSLALFGINFHTYSVNEALQKSKILNKRVYVFFASDRCLACTIMKNGPFKDEIISETVDQNLIPVLVNMDKAMAESWKNMYNIKSLPTCLILDDDGDEVSRVEGGMGIALFKEFINNAVQNKSHADIATKSHQPPTQSKIVQNESGQIMDTQSQQSEAKPMSAPEMPIATSNDNKIIVKPNPVIIKASDGEDKKPAYHQHQNQYIIQFGAFGSASKAEIQQKQLSKLWSESTRIDQSSKSMFKLISNQSYEKAEADKLIKDLKSKGIDCFSKLVSQ